jgi:hypothetical protein
MGRLKDREDERHPERIAEPTEPPARRTYEPPRIQKKRSVSRATLATAGGPDAGGLYG